MLRFARSRWWFAAALALAAAGCRGPSLEEVEEVEDPPTFTLLAADATQDQPGAPTIAIDGKDDWVRLKSGEWLRGEILYLDHTKFHFDSKELDELELDWDDVAEVRTSHEFTLLLVDGSRLPGIFSMYDGKAYLTGEDGVIEIPRGNVFRLTPGATRERDYWSGKVALGTTARAGNVRSIDNTVSIAFTRRTASSRLPISYDSAFSEVEGQKTADNERFRGQFDWFLTRKLYLTPVGIELLSDAFQNTDLRVTPYASLGYTFIDNGDLEVNGGAGLGYRLTRFDSVEAGEPDSDELATGIVSASLDWDLTKDVEMTFEYSAQIGLQSTEDTNQGASFGFEIDLQRDLELDLTVRWDHVGNPQPDSSGVTPKNDDLRMTLGLGWTL